MDNPRKQRPTTRLSPHTAGIAAIMGIVIVLGSFGLAICRHRNAPPPVTESRPRLARAAISPELAAQAARIGARESKIAKTLWAKEMLAQKCGRTFEILWDAINRATNKFLPLAEFKFVDLILPAWTPAENLPHGIRVRRSAGPGPKLTPPDWRRTLDKLDQAGWRLDQIEFRHTQFDPDATGGPKQSQFDFTAHLTNLARDERAVLEGPLLVHWHPQPAASSSAAVTRLEASQISLKSRAGPVPFRPLLIDEITPPENSFSIDPLILYDLDNDGHSEIILAGKNLLYRQHPDGSFRPEPLCRTSPGLISAAVIADFDRDGSADLLGARYEGLVLIKGSSGGALDSRPSAAWTAEPKLLFPMVLTCGDIDQDGDQDLFLAQYKEVYEGGSVPTPYYNANDGNPAFLLLNDGNGHFRDATATSGLTAKRHRRTYSASFIDLDHDDDLDLVVVSDFAGIDLYLNNGRGQFTDLTAQWLPDSHGFGMAHAAVDFNQDGLLDLLMIGMPSPTVDRLTHLGLWRFDSSGDKTMHARMAFGNRLYLALTPHGFRQTSLNDSMARAGWAWGCTPFDFDNDSFPDLYIANGLESNESVRDYEAEFWLHDRFVGTSQPDPAAYVYLTAKFNRTRARDFSYGGYEKNRLYLNQNGTHFVEIAHLMGLAIEQDCRNVAAEDLDGDGLVDLVVTTYEIWPKRKQTLRVYRNLLPTPGHWIGFKFREEKDAPSPIGARVELNTGSRKLVATILTGDSHRSQHANTVRFGLGQIEKVDKASVRWLTGQVRLIEQPGLDRFHRIQAPQKVH